ncbi:MAG: efflux RND transporter permease subunit, partial [Eubacterium sp.]|nr:efflux RND transporter permease subunit [Eubacterium sp.]
MPKSDRPVGRDLRRRLMAKYSVRKPYTVLVGVVLVIVLGIVALSKMTTDLLPDMSFQYALIITTDVGASPEEVESDVTAPIEAAMATTSNIKNITSYSYNSYSVVTCEYEQTANMDSVVIEIQQQLDVLGASWPDSVGSPTIMKINPDMLPVIMAAVDVDDVDESELADYVENDLIPQIESIEGVASVTATGEIEEAVTITMNADKIDDLNKKIKKAVLKQFEEAGEELDDASDQVESGQDAIEDAKSQMKDGADEVTKQKESLYSTEADLKSQLSDLESQKESLEQIQSALSEFMESEVYTETIPEIESAIASLESAKAQLEAAGGDTTEIDAQITELEASLTAINAQIASNFSALSALGISVSTYEDLPTAAATVATTLTQINTGIETIETALEQVEAGKVSLSEALDTLNTNIGLAALDIGTSSAELSVAASSIEEGESSLESAKEEALENADAENVLSMDTLSSLLTAQNFSMPAGYVTDEDGTSYLVKVGDEVSSLEELEDLVLLDMGLDGVDVIKLSDVADIEITDMSGDSYAIVNGNPGVILSVEKQSGYSTGDVTDRVLDKFDALEEAEDGLHLTVLMDQGVYIKVVISSVLENMIWGMLLAILVLIIFLKDLKPTFVIACSIPLSVITAVMLMYFTGITLNIISMSGLMLGIGMLVDNSIVVIENIYRIRGKGEPVKAAAVLGTRQVTGAIFASTLTTVSVYAPIIFTEGITRQLFADLALTIAFTLFASFVVAITFVPALSTVIFKKTKVIKHPWFNAFRDWYGRVLAGSLKVKPLVCILALILLLGSAKLCLSRGMSFLDMDIETGSLSLTVEAADDVNLEFDELTAYSDDIIERISDIDGIDTIGALAGGTATSSMLSDSDAVSMYVILDEDADSEKVLSEIEDKTKDITDVEITSSSSAIDYSEYFGSGLSIQIKGNNLDDMQTAAEMIAEVVENTEGTIEVDDGLDNSSPELRITVDKEKAAEYG